MLNTEPSANHNDYLIVSTRFADFETLPSQSKRGTVWRPASPKATHTAPDLTPSSGTAHSNPVRDPMDEETLVLAAQAGQEWAFTELVLLNRQRVLRSIVRITRNPEDAEDALQEAMLRAFVNLSRFDRRAKFSTWFTRIAINCSLMLLRRKSRGAGLCSDEALDTQEAGRRVEFADKAPNPEQCYAHCETEQHILKAISRLPNTLRSVVDIRRQDEGSMEEIATRLGISKSAAKSRILRARASLRSSLTKRSILRSGTMAASCTKSR